MYLASWRQDKTLTQLKAKICLNSSSFLIAVSSSAFYTVKVEAPPRSPESVVDQAGELER